MLKLKWGNIIYLHGWTDAFKEREENRASGPQVLITLPVT
jgi:hypothetical protein